MKKETHFDQVIHLPPPTTATNHHRQLCRVATPTLDSQRLPKQMLKARSAHRRRCALAASCLPVCQRCSSTQSRRSSTQPRRAVLNRHAKLRYHQDHGIRILRMSNQKKLNGGVIFKIRIAFPQHLMSKHSTSIFQDTLIFKTHAAKYRYDLLCARSITPCKTLHDDILKALHAYESATVW
ncbi:UNVERIFIED_CONTAM: hypothetical protein Slati_0448200 [Sesamum latifolium]|uniref:Uncharacterized protein n=1 Tax=Sesamum latifolium TaxID=2727402 RepID=A0AAW2XX30_9LAMI